jgi:hypothetical protein
MTPTARTVLPTDLVALVSHDGTIYANEAMTLDRLGTQDSPSPLETALEQWFSFATGRHTWISVKGNTLRGLASARKRGSRLAWEIDCLIDAGDDDRSVLMSLLDQVTEAAGKSGALKIFVRVPASSATEDVIARCGFAPYRHETAYTAPAASIGASDPQSLRRRTKADLYGLFQLYSATTPERVRRYEAMTFGEWTAAQESLGKTAHWIIERDGRLGGWLRAARDGSLGRFDVMGETPVLDTLIDAAAARLHQAETLYALVPDHHQDVARRLDERGFTPGESFTVLARRTVRPVKDARRVPAAVSTTFG